MTRRSWIYTPDGRTIEKGTEEHRAYEMEKYGEAPMTFSDEGVFLSPIDGLAYSGKAGMREHNRRHDVVNNRDLVGLPTGVDPKRATAPPSTRQRQELRQAIYDSAMRGKYLEGQ
jgi:hypothetical protein